MSRRLPTNLITDTDEVVTPTRDVLLAVSSVLRGDRKRIKLIVAKTRGRIEKRLRRELGTLLRTKPVQTTKQAKISGARPGTPKRPPPMAPAGAVGVKLPDGRTVRLALVPATARHRDLAALRRVCTVNTEQAFGAIAQNGRAIDRLVTSQKQLASRLAKLQAKGDLALLRGILEGLTKLERRVDGVKRRQDKALVAQKRYMQQKFSRQARALKVQKRAAQIQKLNGTVASVQSAAFGTPGRLLSTNNVLLAANQLGWSFAPQIFEALGLTRPGATNPAAWLAPLASLVTSQAVLGRRQHERFVSGVATDFTVSSPPVHVALFAMVGSAIGAGRFGEKRLSLKSHIAPAEWEVFAKRTDVPVTTVVLEPSGAFETGIWSSGEVSGGILTVRIAALSSVLVRPDMIVAWTVDTRRPDG